MEQTYKFHVSGMHCKSCVLMTESELGDVPEISKVKTSLATHSVEVTGDFGDLSIEKIVEKLTIAVAKHGYTISIEKQLVQKNLSEFKIAVPIAFAFILFFIGLQKLNIVNLVDTSAVSYGTAFFIGIIASLSTCMAVVGGLVLSMSATFAKEGDKLKPQLLFHASRLISFFLLGGAIGALGSAFTLTTTATFFLNLITALIMALLGINLLNIFNFTKKLQPAMPKFIARHALRASQINHRLTPALVGIATFFLPCGFTQSMQIYTLSTHTFLRGALTMFAFALGTLPVLALLSFSSFSIQKNSRAGIFFKSVGLIVILFALFNLINSFVIIGLLSPIFNF